MQPCPQAPAPDMPTLDQALTVAAWIDVADGGGEALQALVSQWRPPDQWPGFAAFDASATDGRRSVGHNGGAFSLRACDLGHNGGQNAGVLGPSFLVNTDRECLRVSTSRLLAPGLHHVAGTYDGKVIRLFVDGVEAARGAGSGRLVTSDLPVTVGLIQDGAGAFRGRVLHCSVTPAAYTGTEIAAMAHAHRCEADAAQTLRLELDTYCVLDGRAALRGSVHLAAGGTHWVRLTATARNTGGTAWQQTIAAAPGDGQAAIELPVRSMPGGYYLVEAVDDQGQRAEVNLVLRAGLEGEAPAEPATRPGAIRKDSAHREVRPPGGAPGRDHDYLAEARAVVDRIIAEQTRRLGDRPNGTPFVTVGRQTGIGYRSLGHKTGDTYQTYWFPEETFEYDTFRLDHDLWPILDQLSALTGDPRYRALTDGMLDALAGPGFDPRSGLLHLSEECDFDVLRGVAHSKRMASDQPKFKPINGGPSTDMHLERFWARLPQQTHRWLRATYYGLVTNPRTMDYNRFCMYGFDDQERIPSLTPNSGQCAFDTAGAGMILCWASCWAHAGDAECLEWARRMTAKWAAVQNPVSGLVPNFFGAVGWNPGAAQPPGEWACVSGAALTAVQWLRAAALLRRRPGAETLAAQLENMGRRLALGVAWHAYAAERRIFISNLCLDGRPYTATARYCFRTQAEKDEAVRRDPTMAQVRVYDGAGLYRHPNYYEHCAGANAPYHLAQAAALCRDPDLVARLRPMLADAVDEAAELDGAFTPEGRWTFRATGWYVRACVHLYRLTGDALHLDQARQLADREIAALQAVRTPHWWRLRERAVWLEALLSLHEARR